MGNKNWSNRRRDVEKRAQHRAINHTLIAFNKVLKMCSRTDSARSHRCLASVYLQAGCVDTLVGSLWLTARVVKAKAILITAQHNCCAALPLVVKVNYGFSAFVNVADLN